MKAGVIGTVEGDFDAIESFSESYTHDNHEFERCVEVRQSITTDNGVPIQTGRVATEKLDEEERVEIEDGEITVYERPEIMTLYTEFLTVPGEFVVVSNSSGVFAFDTIGRETGTVIERAELDIDSFAETNSDANPWKVGFYGHLGEADNGVIHGSSVLDDSDIGDVLQDAKKNQLGVEYTKDGDHIKLTMAESGYIEVYQPSNFDSVDYTEFILEEILQHIE